MPSFSGAELAMWSGGAWESVCPDRVKGVSHDTRTLERGSLYVALRGRRFDGHAFVEDAFRKGAQGAVVANDWRPAAREGRPALLRVADTAQALRDMAAAYRVRLAPRIVAITGSAGKSTVKEMTAQILSAALATASTPGNWNNDIGLPLSLLAMEEGTQVGVFEAGTNHPGELAALCRILKPNWGVVTNVGPVHVEHFGSVEAIVSEKATLIRSLPSDGVAILNRDDAFFNQFRKAAPGRVVSVSMQGNADYVCLRRQSARGEATVVETAGGETFALKMPVPGDHNIANAMLAIAVARAMNVSWEQIDRAMAHYTSLPMRWEEKVIGGMVLINDAYNANPLSMKAAIQTFAEKEGAGGKWLILGGMLELGDRQEEEHLALGRHVGAGSWTGLIVLGSLGRWIARGAEDAGYSRERVFCCEDTVAAARAVVRNMKRGDSALLKASRGIHLESVLSLVDPTGRGAS